MDDEAAVNAKVKKVIHRRAAANVQAITLRITGSLVTMVMLLWAICNGYNLATNSKRYSGYTDWAFGVGVLTMLLGFLFLILGIPILADLFLNLSERLQEEAGIHKAWETKTISKVIAGIFLSLITLVVLWWVRLATEHRRGGKYHLLTTSIGVVTITFGFIYFIIGLAIIAELGLDLFDQLQQKERKGDRHLSR